MPIGVGAGPLGAPRSIVVQAGTSSLQAICGAQPVLELKGVDLWHRPPRSTAAGASSAGGKGPGPPFGPCTQVWPREAVCVDAAACRRSGLQRPGRRRRDVATFAIKKVRATASGGEVQPDEQWAGRSPHAPDAAAIPASIRRCRGYTAYQTQEGVRGIRRRDTVAASASTAASGIAPRAATWMMASWLKLQVRSASPSATHNAAALRRGLAPVRAGVEFP